MALAKELAQELVQVKKEKDEFDRAIEAVTHIFANIKETVTNVWNSIKESMPKIIDDVLEEIEHEKKLRESWHVPIKMDLPKAPFIENHNLQFARSNLQE